MENNMTYSDAEYLLTGLLWMLTKLRSDAMEVLTNLGCNKPQAELMLKDLLPWLASEKCPIVAIQNALDRDNIEPLFVYNLCVISHQLQPQLASLAPLFDFAIPEPDISWMRGFRREEPDVLLQE